MDFGQFSQIKWCQVGHPQPILPPPPIGVQSEKPERRPINTAAPMFRERVSGHFVFKPLLSKGFGIAWGFCFWQDPVSFLQPLTGLNDHPEPVPPPTSLPLPPLTDELPATSSAAYFWTAFTPTRPPLPQQVGFLCTVGTPVRADGNLPPPPQQRPRSSWMCDAH